MSGGSETNTMYVISTNGGNDYIVNRLTDGINSYQDYDIMMYEVAERQADEKNGIASLERRSNKDISSQTEDEEDSTILNTTYGYGTTGKFTANRSFYKPLYIVAVSDNNCRCISPVYDFSSVNVTIILLQQIINSAGSGEGEGTSTTTTEGTDEEGNPTTETTTGDVTVDVTTNTPVTSYKFGIRINNILRNNGETNLYYC